MHCEWSGKFIVLERYVPAAGCAWVDMMSNAGRARFLHRIRTETNDKIVLISNYTQTLDLFEKLLRSKKYALTALNVKPHLTVAASGMGTSA